jgi:hypothetical protein
MSIHRYKMLVWKMVANAAISGKGSIENVGETMREENVFVKNNAKISQLPNEDAEMLSMQKD